MDIKTVCVCGAGTMGSGIAQLAAAHGFKTIQFDINTQVLQKSQSAIEVNFASLVAKGRMDMQTKNTALQQLTFTNDINDCKADIIIEAVAEILDIKVDLFKKLAAVNSATTVFASNTSSLSIAMIAAGVAHPERVAGMHFFNPAFIMKLVEVVRGEQTADYVVDNLCALATALGKTPVVCKDMPGFIVNRVARSYYLEAMHLVEQEGGTPEMIDELMESAGFKMGPFKLMDMIGIDINYSVSKIVYDALGQPERLEPSRLQQQLVEAGKLGRKTGEGFYPY